jgi:predicted RecA/RadA family phage recombinase
MAKNKTFEDARQLSAPVVAGIVSGDPCVVGQRPGVALTDRRADGTATVDFQGCYDLTVNGVDQTGNSAVVQGDILYLTVADPIKVSKKNTGIRFGYAWGAVGTGTSGVIGVVLGY